MRNKQGERHKQQNQRRCFRTLVPQALTAWVEIGLPDGGVCLPLRQLSLESDGHSGGLRLGPAPEWLAALLPDRELPLHIHLPGERVLAADGTLLRWEGEPRQAVLQYRLRDRRGEEKLRRFWAACQRHFLMPIP